MKTIKLLLATAFVSVLISCSKDKEPADAVGATFTNGLTFQKIKDLPNNYYDDQSVGFFANQANSSLYISCRDMDVLQSETILKFNTIDQSFIRKNTPTQDFITKRNCIYNNQLYVFGAQRCNAYNIDLSLNFSPLPYKTNLVLSRFGFTTLNENAYIVGGFIGGSYSDDKKIWKFNMITNSFTEQATMSVSRSGGSSEIVNNKIYTFFGYERIDNPINNIGVYFKFLNDLQIYNLSTNLFENVALTNNVKVSFTAKYNNYIFVAGNKTTEYYSSPVVGSFFGYFNTDTNIMTEIPITVQENNFAFPYICEIEVMNNKIYALVKNNANVYSIQVANLQ